MRKKVSFSVVAILIVAFIVAGFVGQDRKISEPKTSVEERIKALETEIAELKSMLSESSRRLQPAKEMEDIPVKAETEPFSGPRAWTEGTRGWEEDGTNLWTGTAPLNYRVGIGTATPSGSYKLDVDGSTAGDFGRGMYVKGDNYGINVSVNVGATATNSKAIGGSNSSTGGTPIGVQGEAWAMGVDSDGIGGKFEGGKFGVEAKVCPQVGGGTYYGVHGSVQTGLGGNMYGVYGHAGGSGTNYGIYGSASGAGTNYAGYFNGNLNIHNGKILINESAPANKCLTTDASGDPQWSDAPSDGDWTLDGNNMYSTVSGNVGIGDATPIDAKLCVYYTPPSGTKARALYSIGKAASGGNNQAYGGWFEGDNESGGTGDAYGVKAVAKCRAGEICYGGHFLAGQGFMGPICTEYGIYAQAANPTRADAYAGYFKGKSYFDASGGSYAGYFNGNVDVAQNTRIKLGTAYISSSVSGGTEYASFSSNAWFDGTWNIPDGTKRSGTFIWAEQDFYIARTQTAGLDDWLIPLIINDAGLTITDDTPVKPNAGGWSGSSDRRLKKNIQPLKDALKKILALKPRYFEWKEMEDIFSETLPEDKRRSIENGDFPEGEQMGFIAQESIDIIPSLVEKENDGYYMMQYGSMDPLLVSAIQEQQKEIESLTDEVRILKEATEELSVLKAELEEIKTLVAQIGDTSPWRLARE